MLRAIVLGAKPYAWKIMTPPLPQSQRRIPAANILFTALALVALGLMVYRGWRAFSSVSIMRIGVVGDGRDAQLVKALADGFKKAGSHFRLLPVKEPSDAAAAAALEADDVQMIVRRSDAPHPPHAAAIAILHHDAVLIYAASGKKIKSIADLGGRKLGLWPDSPLDRALLATILAQYKLHDTDVRITGLATKGVADAYRRKQVDAVVLIRSQNSAELSQQVGALVALAARPGHLLEIGRAEGLAARNPGLQKLDIPDGYFPARNKVPEDDFSTIGVNTLLAARADLDQTVASNFTRDLFIIRPQILDRDPLAAGIDKPEADKTSAFAVQAGAAAYYSDNEKSFLDRYGDFFYLGAMIFGGLGSGLIALLGFARSRASNRTSELFTALDAAKAAASVAADASARVSAKASIDALGVRVLQRVRRGDLAESEVVALRFALDEARSALPGSDAGAAG